MKNVIVTGASGFIGSSLCVFLAEKGIKVYAIFRRKEAYTKKFQDSHFIIPVFCDMDKIEMLPQLITEDIDVFFHFAWSGVTGRLRGDYDLQIKGIKWTLDSVNIASKLHCKKFVGAGTMAEMDVNNYASKDESTPNLVSNYGSAKISAHFMSKALCNELGIDHLWAVISNTYGENDKSENFINFAYDLILSDRSADFTTGTQWYDFVHISDVVRGIYKIGDCGIKNCSYYIGSGKPQKLKEFINQMAEIIRPEKKINFGVIPFNGVSAEKETYDCKKLMKDTGYYPQILFRNGIKKLHEYRKNQEKFDALVVGCGLSGMIVARELAEKGKKVCIIEKRNHIGGNTFDYLDESKTLVQKYGPHVFFTDDENVLFYIKRFVNIDMFYPECRTYIKEKYVPMPFNFESIDILYEDMEYAKGLKEKLISEFGENAIVSVLDVINSSEMAVHKYGIYMYEHEYKKYTAKQWGMNIDDIDPSIFMRVPVYISNKKSYLQQKFQFMPQGGFTYLAKRIIDHPNITVKLNVDMNEKVVIDDKNKMIGYGEFRGPIVYSGALDRVFKYKYGKLPYRSLEFVWKNDDTLEKMQTALTAFPEGDKYIRATDYTQFPPQKTEKKSVIALEYPVQYRENELSGSEPYYPILTEESKSMYQLYKKEAEQYTNLHVCGRLAEYKYYNMDAVIRRALEVAKKIVL